MNALPALLAPLLCLALAALPAPGAAQEAGPEDARQGAQDAFLDPESRSLIRRARQMRERRDSALQSQEVTFRERIYIGLDADRFRRERALLRQQRAARIRWSRDSDRVVRWLGTRRESPVGEGRVGFGEMDDTFSFLDPGTNLFFGIGTETIHPLADSAAHHYRFRSGDTLGIHLPALGRTVELAEVLVEPREARANLVAGSLWFDIDSGVLVRALYRPARDLQIEEVPWFVGSASTQVDYIVVEYGLERLTWWLPRQIAFQGTVEVGGFRLPMRLEWTFREYALNEPSDLDPGAELPAGWRRRVIEPDSADAGEPPADAEPGEGGRERPAGEAPAGEGGDADPPRPTIVIIPPPDSLERSTALPEPFGAGSRPFRASDLPQLRDRIGRARIPASGLPGPRALFEPFDGLVRYNRVEALAAGGRFVVPLASRTEFRGRALVATATGEPDVQVGLVHATPRGERSFRVYRRLAAAGDWGTPLGLGNSLNALLLGQDDGLYYRTLGGELRVSGSGALAEVEGRFFIERQQNAAPRTDLSVPELLGDDELEGELRAVRGAVVGLGGRVRLQNSIDPGVPALSATAWTEAATGDFDYLRLAGSAAITTPPDASLAGAVEVGAGTVAGRPPPQRRYFLGGPYTVRGFAPDAATGQAFWLTRVEVARSLGLESDAALGRMARVVAFADAGWAGPRGQFGTEGYKAGVGVGFSVMDGLFRVDLARAVHGGNDWRLYLYADGLF